MATRRRWNQPHGSCISRGIDVIVRRKNNLCRGLVILSVQAVCTWYIITVGIVQPLRFTHQHQQNHQWQHQEQQHQQQKPTNTNTATKKATTSKFQNQDATPTVPAVADHLNNKNSPSTSFHDDSPELSQQQQQQQLPFCRWVYPSSDQTPKRRQELVASPCFQQIQQAIRGRAGGESSLSSSFKKNRWLFLGDSTMTRLVNGVQSYYVPRPNIPQPKDVEDDEKNFGPHSVKIGIRSRAYLLPDHRVYSHNYSYTLWKSFGQRCGAVPLYFNMNAANTWTSPNFTAMEGPRDYGRDNPYCTDCSDCRNRQLLLTNTATTTPRAAVQGESQEYAYLEYLVVEYALDVEFPTVHSRTTQETVALYIRKEQEKEERQRQHKLLQQQQQQQELHQGNGEDATVLPSTTHSDHLHRHQKDHLRDDTVCVANTGLHPQKFASMSAQTYVQQTMEYLSLLYSVCGTILWVTMSATMYDGYDMPQTNPRIHSWNVALEEALLAKNFSPSVLSLEWRKQAGLFSVPPPGSTNLAPPVVWGIDVMNTTLTLPHLDSVHLHGDYYVALGLVFSMLITG